jgi:hypothetical protein
MTRQQKPIPFSMRDSRNEAAGIGIFVEGPASDILRSAMMPSHFLSNASMDFMKNPQHFSAQGLGDIGS